MLTFTAHNSNQLNTPFDAISETMMVWLMQKGFKLNAISLGGKHKINMVEPDATHTRSFDWNSFRNGKEKLSN